MQIQNEFTVAQPAEPLWAYLLDVEKIAPCMPGAELTEAVDDTNWKGKVNVDVRSGEAVVRGHGRPSQSATTSRTGSSSRRKGMEAEGQGSGDGDRDVVARAEPGRQAPTIVKMDADITLDRRRGAALARSAAGDLEEAHAAVRRLPAGVDGRGGSGRRRRCGCDGRRCRHRRPHRSRPRRKHVGGISLGLAALWGAIKGFFARLFGGKKSSS